MYNVYANHIDCIYLESNFIDHKIKLKKSDCKKWKPCLEDCNIITLEVIVDEWIKLVKLTERTANWIDWL